VGESLARRAAGLFSGLGYWLSVIGFLSVRLVTCRSKSSSVTSWFVSYGVVQVLANQ
jgi:hypothetical protein